MDSLTKIQNVEDYKTLHRICHQQSGQLTQEDLSWLSSNYPIVPIQNGNETFLSYEDKERFKTDLVNFYFTYNRHKTRI